jgi:hypothetical protein
LVAAVLPPRMCRGSGASTKFKSGHHPKALQLDVQALLTLAPIFPTVFQERLIGY